MEEMFKASFHDANELTQATQFLHENGKLSRLFVKLLHLFLCFSEMYSYLVVLLPLLSIRLVSRRPPHNSSVDTALICQYSLLDFSHHNEQ